MTDTQDQDPKRKPRHALRDMVGLLLFFGLVGISIWQLIVHPSTPLPDQWNPSKPLVVAEPVALTGLGCWAVVLSGLGHLCC